MRKSLIYTICLMFLFVPFTSLLAQDDSVLLDYRQKIMKSNGLHMSMIGDILKYNLPYKDQIANHARAIALNSRSTPDAWKKKITMGKTDSQPLIWSDFKMFSEKAMISGNEAANLANLVESGDMSAAMAQVRTLGRTCGGCHESYRKPKEERFKR